MSLERFSNQSEILETNGLTRGIIWNADDIDSLVLNVKTVTPSSTPVIEVHVYDTSGAYINSTEATGFVVRNDKLYVNYAAALNSLGIRRGFFEVAVNVHKPLFGTSQNQLLQIKEISPDRREILVRLVPLEDEVRTQYVGSIETYLEAYSDAFAIDIAVNFGSNNIIKIINQKDWDGDDDMVMRLYSPLPDTVQLNSTFWIVEELADTYIDNVDLSIPLPEPELTTLRGPNFDIDSNYATITETEFKSWNDLLGSNLSTSQQIIDQYFSGSLSGVPLGIDYTAFDNFIFYSSAYERLANFKYKMELLEFYNNRLDILNSVSGSDDGSLTNNVTITQKRIDNVIGSFDGFERWLYYEPTASLTTHGVSGSFIGAEGYALTPWPKYLSASQYHVHHTTSSIATTWYNGFSATASFYDIENPNALIKTIPEHIRSDVNNDQYELFVNMIGHHFDILYTYVDALTKTYRPEEQPKLGVSRESLYEVAKSMGWTLANGNQATALWQYKLGVNASGSYQNTGSLFSKTNEEITTEVWRRIVNNLPYLLKTKGTARSIKALMNAYGIPQTLLSIREYGGPKVEESVPTLIEDRFAYALQFNSGSYIRFSAAHYSSSIGDWGIPRGVIPPITREWRFRPSVKQNMLLFSENGGLQSGDPLSVIALQYTASYSGSDSYGRIIYGHIDGTTSPYNANIPVTFPTVVSSSWLPLYDGDFWNIRWYYTTTGSHYNTGSNGSTVYNIQVQKASDYITDKIVHSSEFSLTPVYPNRHWTGWGTNSNGFFFYIGGLSRLVNDSYGIGTRLQSAMNINSYPLEFSGSMQEYREWLELLDQTAFDDHTKNPTSYVSALSATGSWDTLVRHYPLGTDLKAVDHTVNTSITSSHPNQTITDFNGPGFGNSFATASGFLTPTNLQRGNYVPVEETYYVQGVSLGASLPRSEKIRLEDNYLIRGLSPTNTGERSSFDYAPLDTNRLGLFYSHADQINKDIFNHIGDVALDDYIGDPDHEFEYHYPDLFHFSKNYWKKYTDRNDINAYIRIFSQFDFSLFNQIKQLLPERVDEAMGLLVEPHALERVKVALTKRPVVENPQYNVVLTQQQPTASAEYILYSASIAMNGKSPYTLTADSLYQSGSGNGYSEVGNTWFANTSVGATSDSMDYCTIEINPVDALPSATASISDVFAKETVFLTNWSPISINALSLNDTSYIASNMGPVGTSTDDLFVIFSTQLQYDTIQNIKIDIIDRLTTNSTATVTVKLVFLDKNNNVVFVVNENTQVVSYTANTDNARRITINNVKIPAFQKIAVQLKYTNVTSFTAVSIDQVSLITDILKVCHAPVMPIIDTYRSSNIFQQIVYHYSGSNSGDTLRNRNILHAFSQSLGLYYSQSLITAPYMDDFFDQTENLIFNGSRISAPDINVNSNIAALGNTPIIEVYNTNPNQLIFTQNPGSTIGGSLEAGNLIVR